jgi:DNA polymerase-3 subunit delta
MELSYHTGIAEALWSSGVQRVYLFAGEEDRLKAEALQALVDHVIPEDCRDFDLELMDASAVGADAILAAAGQVPFSADRRLVLVRGMESWRERAKASEAERLAEGVERLAESACLVMIAGAEEDEGRRKTAVTPKLDGAVKRTGALVNCAGLRGEGLVAWILSRAQAEGKQIRPDAVRLLIDLAGADMLPLEQEILKLACYAGERETIEARDVSAVVSASSDDVIFQVVDAVVQRRTDRSLTLLDELHRHEPNAHAVAAKLLALLARQYRLMWQAKHLVAKRIHPRDVRNLPEEIAANLPTESSIVQAGYRVGDLFTQSRGYEWSELAGALDLLLRCDLANKGGATDETGHFSTDPAGNLQLLVLELTGAAR